MKTLLDGVNDVMKRAGWIAGDNQALTTLTDSPRQHIVDVTVQVWNEAIDTLYDQSRMPKSQELGTVDITLVLDQREYTLPTDMVQLRWPGHDEIKGHYILEYPGGYLALRHVQPIPADFKGQPQLGTINPENGLLYFDFIPQAPEVGLVYTFKYDKDLVLILAADTMPFSDAVFRAMVPAVSQLLRRDMKNDFDSGIFADQIGQAARFLNQKQLRDKW